MTTTRGYHHGDLRRTLLAAAVDVIGESGPVALSLRDLARRAGVSHAAPAHHFGDKAGLLTALAVEGFDLLTDALGRAGDDLLELGVAYVRFAVDHRAHFEVMFRPELYRADVPEVVAARSRAGAALRGGVSALAAASSAEPDRDALAAWSIVHGFATLWLAGALPAGVGEDPEAAARSVIRRLFE
ncbi:TetR family transcriptional regulator [Micromonospora globispora]|uniref:TetR family transcriptional regulator n=1 Tax=Micromonospora globispora TaxID=1450148 RepID=A0A317K618_9ACTN|nr:TetR/AcrR family transcriptional regulator [Micromonospora globispora]PWU48414.1 TetR family transcriptional regulator [Micromonospora globispora]PWU58931.1 TetR family transcriptional regulator [Micromonospora globispora]RQX01782.1 TetR family transcriptional regulator [Micromonospora globispora]